MTENGILTANSYMGFSRLPLAVSPTPLKELKRLSALLRGPRIFVKQEDLSGFGMGGNKVRKFEFFMAEALKEKADSCIAIGGIQSNHVRVAAASAVHCGLEAHLLLMGEKPSITTGNLILDYLLGAKVSYIPSLSGFDERMAAMNAVADKLQEEGRRPYVVPVVDPMGCLGPMMAAEEALQQAKEAHVRFTHQIIPVGSGESLLGVAAGASVSGADIETLGVCVGRRQELMAPIVAETGKGLIEALRAKDRAVRLTYSLLDEYLGEYGYPTKQGLEAIRLLARTEGIFLDPVYGGKAMAALLDLIAKGRFEPTDGVLFWNTTSPPIFFAFDGYTRGIEE